METNNPYLSDESIESKGKRLFSDIVEELKSNFIAPDINKLGYTTQHFEMGSYQQQFLILFNIFNHAFGNILDKDLVIEYQLGISKLSNYGDLNTLSLEKRMDVFLQLLTKFYIEKSGISSNISIEEQLKYSIFVFYLIKEFIKSYGRGILVFSEQISICEIKPKFSFEEEEFDIESEYPVLGKLFKKQIKDRKTQKKKDFILYKESQKKLLEKGEINDLIIGLNKLKPYIKELVHLKQWKTNNGALTNWMLEYSSIKIMPVDTITPKEVLVLIRDFFEIYSNYLDDQELDNKNLQHIDRIGKYGFKCMELGLIGNTHKYRKILKNFDFKQIDNYLDEQKVMEYYEKYIK